MDIFLETLEDKLKIKNETDKLTNKYIENIHNLLLIPLLTKTNNIDGILKFNEIFKPPYNEEEYRKIFDEILSCIN